MSGSSHWPPAGRVNGIQFLHVQNAWKPVLLLRKGNQTLREWTGDLISYDWEKKSRQVKQLHKWEQAVSPLQKLIRATTAEGDLVVDPFCGSGTTAIAAISTARRFAGCDCDATAVNAAVARLRECNTSRLVSGPPTRKEARQP